MNPEPNDNSATSASFLRMMGRACHPARWGLCAVGLAASLLLSALALAVFERTSLHLEAWLQDPLEQLQSLGQQLFGYGSGTAVFRCFLLTAVLSVVWSFVGG